MIRPIIGANLIVVMASGVCAQTTSSVRDFEVASIRPHQGRIPRIGISTAGTRLNAEAETVRGLIMYAYNVRNYQVSVLTRLFELGSTPYDVIAKAEGDGAPTTAQFRQMLQVLLADRFKLKVHREMREMRVYELVIGKNGPKFKESAPNASPMGHFEVVGRNCQLRMPKATMDEVADQITNVEVRDRPVLNKTALPGTYNISMTYTPNTRRNQTQPELDDISIFTAVQDQLGLKLEAGKAMVEIIVVDHVEKAIRELAPQTNQLSAQIK